MWQLRFRTTLPTSIPGWEKGHMVHLFFDQEKDALAAYFALEKAAYLSSKAVYDKEGNRVLPIHYQGA